MDRRLSGRVGDQRNGFVLKRNSQAGQTEQRDCEECRSERERPSAARPLKMFLFHRDLRCCDLFLQHAVSVEA